jgi:HPt (histidine-containing phosphotransfer) domain-containing protein
MTMRIIPAPTAPPAAGDCEIIPVSDDLRRKALVLDCTLEEGIERAARRGEATAAQVRAAFGDWIGAQSARLAAAHRDYRETPGDEERLKELYRAAHDLRGGAPSFGYPLAGRIAHSLSRLLGRVERPSAILVEQHVKALQAVIREGARAEDDPIGAALAAELEILVDEAIDGGR